jgi:hypothetical protein
VKRMALGIMLSLVSSCVIKETNPAVTPAGGEALVGRWVETDSNRLCEFTDEEMILYSLGGNIFNQGTYSLGGGEMTVIYLVYRGLPMGGAYLERFRYSLSNGECSLIPLDESGSPGPATILRRG